MEQTITEQILKDIHDDLQVIISQDKERKECEMQVKSDLKELRIVLMGIDGTNGLRSVSKRHSAEIEDLKRWKVQAMVLFAMMQLFLVPVGVYLLQQIFRCGFSCRACVMKCHQRLFKVAVKYAYKFLFPLLR